MALNESGERMLATVVCCAAVAIGATALRFWCKIIMRTGIQANDWWMLATLIIFLAAQSIILWGLFAGSQGKEIAEITAELFSSPSQKTINALETYLESLFVGLMVVYGALFGAKISVCLMYRRMFPLPTYRLISDLLMALTTAWLIASIVANLCICIPIDIFWHRLKPGRCLNFNLFYLIDGIAEIVIDAAILSLPIYVVQTLHLPPKTRVLLMGIFLLGGFAIVTNILRVYYSYQPNEQYVSLTKSSIWLQIHIAITILCASTPVYKPIRNGFHGIFDKMRSWCGSSFGSFRSSFPRKTPDRSNENQDSHDRMNSMTREVDSAGFLKQSSSSSGDGDNILILAPDDSNFHTAIGYTALQPDRCNLPLGGIERMTKIEVA